MKAPLLFTLQLCPLDVQAGESLLRLIADVCPSDKYVGVDLAISLRPDTAHCLMPSVAKKFNQTWIHRTERMDKGWPGGCNTLAYETVKWFRSQNQKGRWNYSGIFLAEADALPMRRDWLEAIVREWNGCRAGVLGYWDKREPGDGKRPQHDHINGNCIISREFANAHPHFPKCPREIAWDFFWREAMLAEGCPSKFIFNDYKLGTERNPLQDADHLFSFRRAASVPGVDLQVAYLHGCKEWQRGQEYVRERLLLTAGAKVVSVRE